MKRTAAICMCVWMAGGAFALSLNEESQKEAALFNRFLQAVYAQRQSDPKAFFHLQQALENAPDSKYLKRLLVSSALAAEKPQLAEPYIDFIKQGENDPEDWSVYAAYQWKTGNTKEAQTAYETALAQNPEDPRILYQYVLLLALLDTDQAAGQLSQLAEKYPPLASDAYTEAGNLYLRRRDLKNALAFFEKGVQAAPDNPAPRLGRGEVYEKSSQYFLMLHEFEELEKMGYANAATLSRMGSVFLLVKDYPKAESYFLKAKADAPSDPASAYFLALLAEQKGEYSRAVGYLKDAADYEESASKQLQAAFYLKRLNQAQESLKTLERAYKKFGDDVEVAYFYSLALSDAKQYKKAARVQEKILRTNPDYHDARLQYAYTLDSLKKYNEMETQLQILLDRQPGNAPALNLYAYNLAERGIRLGQAQEYAARALAVYPEDVSFIDTQAWIYYKQNQPEKALDLLNSVPDEDAAANPEIAYHKGAVCFTLQKWEEARKYLNMARSEIKAAAKLYKKLPAEK